jgi:autotransporter-associated beta strand protein
VGGITKVGSGELELAGTTPNVFGGTMALSAGALTLNKTAGVTAVPGALIVGDGIREPGSLPDSVFGFASNQIADDAPITVTASGLLDLGNGSDTIGPLTIGGGDVFGNVTLGGDVQASGTGAIFANINLGTAGARGFSIAPGVVLTVAALQGTGGINKTGAGTLALVGTNAYTGVTLISQGTVLVNGKVPGPVAVAGGTLMGTGTVGGINVTSGELGPGASPGRLTSNGTVSFGSAGTMRVEINGTTAATQYDQLTVAGSVLLGNAALAATFGFAPSLGQTFILIDNDGTDPVNGTFAGLPEGAVVHAGSVSARITYVGGTGNDVALTAAALTSYLAEGATSDFFDMQIALMNPSTVTAANATLSFLRSDGAVVPFGLTVPPRSRRTVDPKTVAGLQNAEFSTVVDTDTLLVVDRTMTWGNGYGSHAETSVAAPALTWYLAEGATHSNFNLFYLIQNPNGAAANVQVTYLRPEPDPAIVRSYTVAPNSRFNIWVNLEDAGLAAADVSAVLQSTNGQPIIVERAVYLDGSGRLFDAGHESAAITTPSLLWFLAEGATGSFFDLFVLIANPNAAAAELVALYLLPSGATISRSYTVAPNSRFNVWVDLEDALLADTAVSATIASTNGVPVIVERAMWWPGDATTWHEAHNSPGATATGTQWGLAEGEVGGVRSIETYILIANTSAFAGSAQVTLLFEDGSSVARIFPLNPNSRFSVSVATEFPEAAGRRFGAIVESLGGTPAQIVVERAMYSNALGNRLGGGHQRARDETSVVSSSSQST